MAMMVDLDLLRQELPEDRNGYIEAIDATSEDVISTYQAIGVGNEAQKKERIEAFDSYRQKVDFSTYAMGAKDKLKDIPGVSKALAGGKIMGELEFSLLALSHSEFASQHTLDLLSRNCKAEYNKMVEDAKSGVIAYLK